MPPQGRPLTIHCATTDPLEPSVPDGVLRPTEGSVHIWYAKLDDIRPRHAEFDRLLQPEEQERAQRFRFDTDRERYVLGHGLLRVLLGRYLTQEPASIRMARGRFGKPYVEGSDLHFSFSDTKDAILVAFATGAEIGADIETMHRKVDHEGVSGHFFTGPEIGAITAAGPNAKRRFLEFWTRKEAVLKASGTGIMDDLHSLRVDQDINELTIRHPEFVAMAAPLYHVQTWQVGADHIVSMASPQQRWEVKAWNAIEV